MSYKHEVINVKVSQRILWVGAEAYPLHNIARVQTNKLVHNRVLALWGYLKAIVLWVFLGVAVVVVTGWRRFDTNTLRGLVGVVVLVLIVVSTIKLIAKLRTHYELVIETAGTPYRALVNPDKNLVTQLVHQITKAINDPHAKWMLQVTTYHFGDNIHQSGDRNVGKVEK